MGEKMKEIKRILSVEEAEELRQCLRKKKFAFRNRFSGYEEVIHYTTSTRLKVHFIFSPCLGSDGEDMIKVKFHIDNVYEKHHRLSTKLKDYERILKWLALPSELAFGLTGAFTKKKWVAKRFRRRALGSKNKK